MSNQPVYRYPPRSHARNCPCARCVQCRSRPSPGSDLITFDMGCLGVVLVFAAVSGIAGWVGRNGHAALEVLPAFGVLALIIWAVVFLNRRAARPPKGRLRVEVLPDATSRLPEGFVPPSAALAPPAPPSCQHPHAVEVDHMLGGEPWAWLCPPPPEGCGQALRAEFGTFARSCCGTLPGTRHVYNCPHLKGSPS